MCVTLRAAETNETRTAFACNRADTGAAETGAIPTATEPAMSLDATSSAAAHPLAAPLAQVLAGLRRHLGVLGVFSVAITLLLLAPTLYMLQVYDRVLPSGNLTTLAMLTVLVIGLYGVLAALEAVRSAIGVRLAMRADRQLAPLVFDAALAQPAGVGGALLAGDLATLRQAVAGPLPGLLFDLPLALVFVAVAFLVDAWLGAFVCAAITVLLVLAVWQERRLRSGVAEANQCAGQATARLSEAMRHAETVRALGLQSALGARWTALNDHARALQLRSSATAGHTGAVMRGVRLVTQSLALGVGALLVLEHRITPGMMIAASVLLGRALTPVEGLVGQARQLAALRDAWRRLNGALARPAAVAPLVLPAARGRLQAENLAWAAGAEAAPLLANVNFTLEPGQGLGIVGASGAGKSTLARLLCGALEASAGQVRLDGAELAQWPTAQRAAAIGVLPQDVVLFEGTVAENIARMGAVDDATVLAAAQRAGVHELVLRLPQGYQTPVGAGGVALSGGQRQRIGLARALYGQPALLILDEPNAHLDEAGEQALQQAVLAHRRDGGSVVVVSHRMPLLHAMDQLLVLRPGAAPVLGPREALMKAMLAPVRRPAAEPAEPVARRA